MGWSQVDDKYTRNFEEEYVSLDDPYETEYVINIIMEEFPWLRRQDVRSVLETCRRELRAPRSRNLFFERVARKLELQFPD